MRLRYLSGVLIFLYLCSWAFAQTPIELKRADLLTTKTGPNGVIRHLDGDVWILQDTLSVTCEHARFEEATGILYSEEKVHFIEPTRQMWADKATYFEKDGRAIAEGHVRILQDSILVHCDRVNYNEDREEALLYGNVSIFSMTDRVMITGDHGKYNRAREYGMMTEQPVLTRHFESDDSLVIQGRIIEYFFGEEFAVVTDSVQIIREEFHAWGQKLFYWEKAERAKLFGAPLLKHKFDILAADTVDAYFAENKLIRVILTGQALATSPVDTVLLKPVNRMTGHVMEFIFLDDEIDSIYVNGNATSTYYIREEGEGKGANVVSGDKINMWMSEGQMSWIYVEGGTEGTYYPNRLAGQIEEEDGRVKLTEREF
ncbi:MAG: LptA/OstA family protein [bacterium]